MYRNRTYKSIHYENCINATFHIKHTAATFRNQIQNKWDLMKISTCKLINWLKSTIRNSYSPGRKRTISASCCWCCDDVDCCQCQANLQKKTLIISGRFKCERKYEEEAERLKIPLRFHHISCRHFDSPAINWIFTFSFIQLSHHTQHSETQGVCSLASQLCSC